MIDPYIELGWDLKLIPAGEKGPRDTNWPELRPGSEQIARHLAAGGNVGVRLGRPWGGLADADLDCVEAITLAPVYLPPTGAIFGRLSKPRSHWVYIAHAAIKKTFTDPLLDRKNTLVELRADGRDG